MGQRPPPGRQEAVNNGRKRKPSLDVRVVPKLSPEDKAPVVAINHAINMAVLRKRVDSRKRPSLRAPAVDDPDGVRLRKERRKPTDQTQPPWGHSLRSQGFAPNDGALPLTRDFRYS